MVVNYDESRKYLPWINQDLRWKGRNHLLTTGMFIHETLLGFSGTLRIDFRSGSTGRKPMEVHRFTDGPFDNCWSAISAEKSTALLKFWSKIDIYLFPTILGYPFNYVLRSIKKASAKTTLNNKHLLQETDTYPNLGFKKERLAPFQEVSANLKGWCQSFLIGFQVENPNDPNDGWQIRAIASTPFAPHVPCNRTVWRPRKTQELEHIT